MVEKEKSVVGGSENGVTYKFEKLETWQLALAYVDTAYEVANHLPKAEEYNLKSQLIRAATSVALNLAEGSTGQTDLEFARFVGLASRSLIETVACMRLIARRSYTVEKALLDRMDQQAGRLFAKMQALRKALDPGKGWVREDENEWSGSAEG